MRTQPGYRARPAIEYGDGAPRTRWECPIEVDGYDPLVLYPQAATAVTLSGITEYTWWNTVRHVVFRIPGLTYSERAAFHNCVVEWLVKGKPFRLYPDREGDSYFDCVAAPGWTPKWQPVVPGVVWATTCEFRRTDDRA